MLIRTDSGAFTAGPLDVLCILQLPTGRFHVAFFEEKPLPGPIPEVSETTVVRLQSRMHHSGGADTLEGARKDLGELRKKIEVPDQNVCERPVKVADPVSIFVVPNWRTGNFTLSDVLTG